MTESLDKLLEGKSMGRFWLDEERKAGLEVPYVSYVRLNEILIKAQEKTKDINNISKKIKAIDSLIFDPVSKGGLGYKYPKGYPYSNNDTIRTFAHALEKKEVVCRDLTTIFISIGQKIELDFQAVYESNHVFLRIPESLHEGSNTMWLRFYDPTNRSFRKHISIFDNKPSKINGIYYTSLTPKKTLAMIYGCVGNRLNKSKRFDEAKHYFNKTLKLDPKQPIALSNLGVIYWQNDKDYTRAKKQFEKVIELIPDDDVTYVNLGLMYTEMRDFGNAFTILREGEDKNKYRKNFFTETLLNIF